MEEITAKKLYEILEEQGVDPDKLQELVVRELAKRGKRLATAESCTGGLISKRITEVSGASEVFDCGVCSYANFIKHKLLGVKNETLDTVGAVSSETAAQMSEGVRRLAGADYGVSATGIAGPTGGTAEKPVGLVYISVSSGDDIRVVKALLGDIDNTGREEIRKAASDAALWLVLNCFSQKNRHFLQNRY